MKFNSIITVRKFTELMGRLPNEVVGDIMKLQSFVTEKLHGENLRIWVKSDGTYRIGRRNTEYLTIPDHYFYSEFSDKTKADLDKIVSILCDHYYVEGLHDGMCFYGELIGNQTLQKGFDWPFEGLEIRWFGIRQGDVYFSPLIAFNFFKRYNLPHVPIVGVMPLVDALNLDVETMASKVASNDNIEGVVIEPFNYGDLWRFKSRFIIKHKTKLYSEEKTRSKSKKSVQKSKFTDFVTTARIMHAIERMHEDGVTIKNAMEDMKYLHKYVADDIANEENDGNALAETDIRQISREVAYLYRKILNDS